MRNNPQLAHGFTVREVARRFRVSPAKVRTWIRLGILGAINTNPVACGKRRLIILPEHLAAFETQHATAPPPKPVKRRKRSQDTDFYPDL
jgi:hypothetical protein